MFRSARTLSIILVCSMIVLLQTSCSYLEEKNLLTIPTNAQDYINRIDQKDDQQTDNVSEPTGALAKDIRAFIDERSYDFHETFSDRNLSITGTINHTVLDSLSVTNIYDNAIDLEKMSTEFSSNYWDSESGNLVGSSALLIFTIQTENVDASSSSFNNPYVFSLNFFLLNLCSINNAEATTISEIQLSYQDAIFYELIDSCSESSFAFECKPGSTITFKIGFIIDDIQNVDLYILSTVGGTLDEYSQFVNWES